MRMIGRERVSIIHKALKKAEGNGRGSSNQQNGLFSQSIGDDKRALFRRLLVIVFIFTILLIFVYYFPEYYKQKKTKSVMQSITIVAPEKSAQVPPPDFEEEFKIDGAFRKEGASALLDVKIEGTANELASKGIFFFSNGNYEKAQEYFSAAIKENSGDAELYNNLALALKKQNMYKESLRNYNRALELREDYKECYNNIGVLYDNLNQYEKAITNYKKAIDLDKGYKDPYFNLAVTYEKMKKYKLASAYYKDYLKFFENIEGKFLKGIQKKVDILDTL